MRLLVIFGPPAVGKMTVGRAVADRSEFRLFHNHATIEPLLEVFDYGTPPFTTLMGEWRRRVVEEAAGFGTDLLFTFVWGLELEADAVAMEELIAPYAAAGAEVAFVELVADLDTRLARNRTEHRLAEKRSKRDVAWSDDNLRELERHVMSTRADRQLPADALLSRHPHLVLDNTDLSADEAAEWILAWLPGPASPTGLSHPAPVTDQ